MIRTNMSGRAGMAVNIPRNGLIAEYTMDSISGNILRDTSGNGHDMTIYNAVQESGAVRKALRFDETTGSYAAAATSVIPVGAKTIAFWVRLDAITGATSRVFSNKNQQIDAGVSGQFNAGTSTLVIDVSTSSGAAKKASIALTLGVFAFVAVTWDGTTNANSATAYANGMFHSWFTPNADSASAYPLIFAVRPPNSDYPTPVTLDQFRVWDRALTSEEVMNVYFEGVKKLPDIPVYPAVPRNGLIAEYTMDAISGATLTDTSGAGNHLTLSDTQQIPGRIGKALLFSGIKGTQAISDNAVIPVGAKTISFWFRPDLSNTSTQRIITNKATLSETGFGINFISGSMTVSFTSTSDFTYSPTMNRWSFFTFTWNGTASANGCSMYVDGVLYAQKTLKADSAASSVFTLGSQPATTQPLAGALDQVRIYNRVISAEEVLSLYNEASPGASQ